MTSSHLSKTGGFPWPSWLERSPLCQHLARDKFLLLATVGLYVAVALPLTQARFLPLTDLPNHTALAALLRHMAEGDPVASYHFETQPHPTPYWLSYLLLWGLGYVVGPTLAAHPVVAVCLLLTPLGAMRLLIALGRSPRMGLWAFAVVWDFSLNMGFVAYSLATGMSFFYVARCLDALRTRNKSRRSLLTTAALGLLLPFTHAHATGTACVLLFVLALFGLSRGERSESVRRGRAPLRTFKELLAWSVWPALGLLPWIASSPGGAAGPLPEHFIHWPPAGDRLASMFRHTVQMNGTMFGRQALGMVLVMVLFLPLIYLVRGQRFGRFDKRALVLYATAWGLYFLMPAALYWPFHQIIIYQRHATTILVMGLMLPRIPHHGPWSQKLVGPGLVAALLTGATVTFHFRAFHRQTEPFSRIVEAVPPHSRVIAVMWAFRTPESVHETLSQLPSYIVAEKGGYLPQIFETPNLPVHLRTDHHLPFHLWKRPDTFSVARHGTHYDYILVQGKQRDGLRPVQYSSVKGPVTLHVAAEAGMWRLYEVAHGEERRHD